MDHTYRKKHGGVSTLCAQARVGVCVCRCVHERLFARVWWAVCQARVTQHGERRESPARDERWVLGGFGSVLSLFSSPLGFIEEVHGLTCQPSIGPLRPR